MKRRRRDAGEPGRHGRHHREHGEFDRHGTGRQPPPQPRARHAEHREPGRLGEHEQAVAAGEPVRSCQQEPFHNPGNAEHEPADHGEPVVAAAHDLRVFSARGKESDQRADPDRGGHHVPDDRVRRHVVPRPDLRVADHHRRQEREDPRREQRGRAAPGQDEPARHREDERHSEGDQPGFRFLRGVEEFQEHPWRERGEHRLAENLFMTHRFCDGLGHDPDSHFTSASHHLPAVIGSSRRRPR